MRHAMQWMAANMAIAAVIIGTSNDLAMKYGTTIMARTDSKATCRGTATENPHILVEYLNKGDASNRPTAVLPRDTVDLMSRYRNVQ